jgi:hypothetical protein
MLIFGGFSIASVGPSRKYMIGGLGPFADLGVVAAEVTITRKFKTGVYTV